MFRFWNSPRPSVFGDDRGVAVVEFALALPVLLLMGTGFIEVGRAYYQADALEKSIRAAAEFGARNPLPLSAAAQTQAENLVRTGTLDGSGAVLVDGFAGAGGSVSFSVTTFDPGTGAVPVLTVSATVPYTPILSGLASWVGLNTISIEARHEQAYLGT